MVFVVSISQLLKCCKSHAQWIAAAGVLMLMTQTGLMAGWTSPNLARLTSENATIPLTLTQASWVASFLNLGRFIGAVLVALFIEYIGSERTILSIFFFTGISWIFLMFGNSVEYLYIGRIIAGVSFAMAYGSFSIYLGEVSAPRIRGTMISLAMCGAQIGTVISTAAETYLPPTISCSIYLLQCFVAILLFKWLPESPHHLVKINNLEGARNSIEWYRADCGVEEELDGIKKYVESNTGQSLKNKFRQFKSPPIKRALILVIILFIFPQMCGLFNILFYLEIILNEGKAFLVNPHDFVIYANGVAVVSTILAIRLMDILGRRILLIISSSGTTVAMLGLGTHFYLLNNGFDSQSLQWLPLVCVLLFIISFTLGFMTVPSTVLSEIFPANVKSIASLVTSLTAAFFGFVSTKSYQPMIDALGESYVFWTNAGFSVLAIPCALFLLPETKGKSFQQIQDDLLKASSN